MDLFLLLLPSTSPVLLSFFLPRTLRRPPSPIPTRADRGTLSRLQIGLVVLRVHQDNSCLALCLFQENRASGGQGPGRNTRGRKGNGGSGGGGAYCTTLVRAWFVFWPFRRSEESLVLCVSLTFFLYSFLPCPPRHTGSVQATYCGNFADR